MDFVGADPAAFVWSENGTRRNLSASQRALVAAAFLEYERATAKKRAGIRTDLRENLPAGDDEGRARDKAGERMGVCFSGEWRIMETSSTLLDERATKR